jgi:hypothetical protein
MRAQARIYFTPRQRALSLCPCTVAEYRDAFMLFLDFATIHYGKSSATMTLADITPEVILAFLDHLGQQVRHNAVRSHNTRDSIHPRKRHDYILKNAHSGRG